MWFLRKDSKQIQFWPMLPNKHLRGTPKADFVKEFFSKKHNQNSEISLEVNFELWTLQFISVMDFEGTNNRSCS